MRRTANLSKRSTEKKKSLNLQRVTNIAFTVIFLVIFLAISNALFKNIQAGIELWREKNTLIESQIMVKDLEKQIIQAKTPEFIEHYAREKLDMLKSGEFVIIVNGE
jgi:cell division protein FtsB